MAGKQRDYFNERKEKRRDKRCYDYHENRRSPNPYSTDEERDQNNSYSDNYRSQRRNSQRDNWNERRYNRERSNYRSRSRERDHHNQKHEKNYESNGNDNNDSYETHERGSDRRKEDFLPNNTIMLRNLGLQTNEAEIMANLSEYGLQPKEIRLMRKKDTGESRGFAFVEFNNVSEAIYWKDQTQGYAVFSDGQQASLHFSIPKEAFNADRNIQQKTDWTCYKCGVVNFKRRDVCFKCSTTREESAANETGDEISPVPTNCLLFRNLNPYTTEERILTILGTLTSLPIKSIKIPKENSMSLCVCFVELYTTVEASQIFSLLSTLTSGFIVDDFPITICYAKRNVPNSNGMNTTGLKNAASMALAAAQWTNQKDNHNDQIKTTHSNNANNSTTSLIDNLKNTKNNLSNPNFKILIPINAPVLKSGIDLGVITVNNVVYKKYPLPDASTYQYEETSGFYYDSMTCLYYDPNSHYYYNGATQKYLYWCNNNQTYLPIEILLQKSEQNLSNSEIKDGSNASSLISSEEKAKNDKVKIAKKIAKDMEKWAKSLNQKKDTAKTTVSQTSTTNSEETSLTSNCLIESFNLKEVKPKLERIVLLDAFNESENILNEIEEDKKDVSNNNIQKLNLTDWNKLICLLCKRQFVTKQQLNKHQQASELHKSNLFKLTGLNFTQEQIVELSANDGEFNFNYRDRAKERRLKYGQPDVPEINKYKEKYLKSRTSDEYNTTNSNYTDNVDTKNSLQNSIGAKLLKQMGWSDGQGLGKSNQGRPSLIEVERRAAGVGLGIKTTSHPSGESYKDAVKRTMMERYKALHEKELNLNSS